MIAIFLAEGFEVCEALTQIDLLRRARLDIKSFSITDSKDVLSSHGVVVKCDGNWSDFENEKDTCEAVILPGGTKGSENLGNFAPLCDFIKQLNSENKLCCAICAAPTVFGKIGILNSKNYTCFPGFESPEFGGNYTGESFTHDDNIITGRAMNSSVDFAREIIKTLAPDKPQDVDYGIQY